MAERLQPSNLILNVENMETNSIDLSKRSSWTEDNAEMVAKKLSFECNTRFKKVYADFCQSVVNGARVCHFLASLARAEFEKAGCTSQKEDF